MKTNVGIHGLGIFLPEEIRTNAWWPRNIVENWIEKSSAKLDRPADSSAEVTEGAKIVLEEMAKLRNDPFKGSRERRIMAEDMQASDMERLAAEQAIAKSGVDPREIGLLLSTTCLPDFLMVPNAAKLHKALGLGKNCLSLQTEGVCNSFLMQLALAEQMIAGGQAKYALLIQSSAVSRFLEKTDPMSAWMGDAATAVVVGPVSEGHGILGRHHETDGEYYDGIVCGIPNKRWWEGGAPLRAYLENPGTARRLLLETIHRSKTVIGGALADAGLRGEDIEFYAAHQGFGWLPPATQRLAGLMHSKTVVTFHWASSVLGANLPLVLATGEKEGLLRSGDRVAMFSGAAGASLSSIVMRWGR